MKTIYAICLLCCYFQMNAQFVTIEDLQKKVKNSKRKAKVDALNDLSVRYLSDGYINATYYFNNRETVRVREQLKADPEAAYSYIQQAIKLANRLKYQDGLAVAYFLEGNYHEENSDINTAETSYLTWKDLRIKQGDPTKIRWAFEGMSDFYYRTKQRDKSYSITDEMYLLFKNEPMDKQEKLVYLKHQYLKARYEYLKSNRDISKVEAVLPHLLALTQHIIKSSNYANTTENLQLKIGNPTDLFISFTEFFEYEILNKLADKKYEDAYQLGIKWIETRAEIENIPTKSDNWIFAMNVNKNHQLYLISRKIGKYFYTKGNNHTEETLFFIKKSVEYAQLFNEEDHSKYPEIEQIKEELAIQPATLNACFYTRTLGKYMDALTIAMAGKDYIYPFDTHKSALNTCANEILYQKNEVLNQTAFQLIQEWQTTLTEESDQGLYQWCEDYLVLLRN